MGTVNGSGPTNIETAFAQLKNVDEQAELRVVKAKNGEIQVKTGQAKGRFRQYRIIPFVSKIVTLYQQKQLVKQLQQLSPQTQIPLNERKVVTLETARSFLQGIQPQASSANSEDVHPVSPTPGTSAAPSRSIDELDRLFLFTKEGDTSGRLQEALNNTEDLEFVKNLESQLNHFKHELTADPNSQQNKNYTAVKFRTAELTGINLVKQLREENSSVTEQQIRDQLELTKFSGRNSLNLRLQEAAIQSALIYLENHPVEVGPSATSSETHTLEASPSDIVADYYLRGFEDQVTDIDNFHKQFEEGLHGLGKDDDAIEWIAKQITDDGDPRSDVSGATHLVKQILVGSDVSPKAFRTNKKHYNQLRDQTRGLSIEASPVPKDRSRYANITSPAETNVPIALEASDGNTYEYQGQIHANYVTVEGKNQAIATQYPINNTKNEDANNQAMGMFWRMAAQQETDIIIDLTQARDGHKPYYPTELGQTLHYDGMDVTLKDQGNNFYTYSVTDTSTGVTTELLRYNFPDWIDKTPLPADKMYQLADMMSSDAFQNMVMHCSAGVGRTGTAYAADSLITLIRQGSVNDDNIDQVVDHLIMRMRPERGPQTVQTEAQRKSLVEMYHYMKANNLE